MSAVFQFSVVSNRYSQTPNQLTTNVWLACLSPILSDCRRRDGGTNQLQSHDAGHHLPQFDLDIAVERRSIDEASLKWGRYKRPYLQSPSDPDAPAVSLLDEVLPMWVADMDFRSPPCVLQALQDRVAHGLFGYTAPSERLNRNVVVSVMTKVSGCFHILSPAVQTFGTQLHCVCDLIADRRGRTTSRGVMHGRSSLVRLFG
eukprot:COSAG02_NODE_16801_length_1054_cov_1.848168_1_plen_202_part_00